MIKVLVRVMTKYIFLIQIIFLIIPTSAISEVKITMPIIVPNNSNTISLSHSKQISKTTINTKQTSNITITTKQTIKTPNSINHLSKTTNNTKQVLNYNSQAKSITNNTKQISKELLDQVLHDTNCKFDDVNNRFECKPIDPFKKYEWDNENIDEFVNKLCNFIKILQKKYKTQGYKVEIQGFADSTQIFNIKHWSQVTSHFCKGDRDDLKPITNNELAWLRSCIIQEKIEKKMGKDVKILEVKPKAYTVEDGKIGEKYRVVKIYIPIFRFLK